MRSIKDVKKLWRFYHENFDEEFCTVHFFNQQISVIDRCFSKINFTIKNNRVFSPDTEEFYT